MNDKRHLGAIKREPAPYQGNIITAYHDLGATNGWKSARHENAMHISDQTVKTRRVSVNVSRTEHCVVIVEVQNATEEQAAIEARYLLQRQPELLDGVKTWSKPSVYGYGYPTDSTEEPVGTVCMVEEYERRRDLHKNAVRIPVTFGNKNQEGKS